jgi:hypothetical protein
LQDLSEDLSETAIICIQGGREGEGWREEGGR